MQLNRNDSMTPVGGVGQQDEISEAYTQIAVEAGAVSEAPAAAGEAAAAAADAVPEEQPADEDDGIGQFQSLAELEQLKRVCAGPRMSSASMRHKCDRLTAILVCTCSMRTSSLLTPMHTACEAKVPEQHEAHTCRAVAQPQTRRG